MPRFTLSRGVVVWPVLEVWVVRFLGLTILRLGASVRRIPTSWKETAVDTTVKQIGAVVVGELRAAGYLDSTIGQYEKTIRALAVFVEEHGGVYTPASGAVFASMTISPRTGRFSAQRRFDYRRLVGVFDGYLATSRRIVKPRNQTTHTSSTGQTTTPRLNVNLGIITVKPTSA